MESGQTIAGKYRLGQLLGNGGMASVWSATNIFTDRQFAMKFMLPSVAKTPEAAHRFLMEAKVSARVDHPNIIEVIDVGQTEEGTLFLVMELLIGVPLETAMRRQSPPMSLHEFTVVMVQVARALAAAHRSGVVHRDLKPTNVFLHETRDRQPVVKLLDFGVSKFLEDEPTHLTVAGTVLGSPLYMSPEQALGVVGIDHRTDIFAFGAIMFEAMCGYRAYDGPNFNALLVKIATTPPKPIDEAAPHMPEVLRAIVRECMVTDRRERTVTMDEVAQRLFDALPELERTSMRVPSPKDLGAAHDPDATNALPVIKAGDRPSPPSEPMMRAPAAGTSSSSMPASGSGSTASSRTPGGVVASRAALTKEPKARWRSPAYGEGVRWFVGGALATATIALAAAYGWRGRPPQASSVPFSGASALASPRPLPTASASAVPLAKVDAGAEPPTVSIDALPVAAPHPHDPSK